MIEWRKLDQPQFDSVIELLLRRANKGRRVDVVDGRGGDGGIDVRVIGPPMLDGGGVRLPPPTPCTVPQARATGAR